MRNTENYGLNIAEGSDKYNHLTIDNPNYEKIDKQMKVNETYSVPIATELKADTVHALTRLTPSASLFRFTATSNFQSGETFTVDNEQVTALLPSGETLGNLAYTIGAEVLCCLVGTRLTVYVPQGVVAKASDSERLNGEEASYYGTAEGVENAQKTADAAGVLATQNQADISALKISSHDITFTVNCGAGGTVFGDLNPQIPSDEKIINVIFFSGWGQIAYLASGYTNNYIFWGFHNFGSVSNTFNVTCRIFTTKLRN